MIHILGTSHKFQTFAPGDASTGFGEYVSAAALRLSVTLLAEEMSQEALDQQSRLSVISSVAGELKIKHLFCDPTSAQRSDLGVRSSEEIAQIAHNAWLQSNEPVEEVAARERRKDFPAREGFWLDTLAPFHSEPHILFICGADHVCTFRTRARARGLCARVQARDWPDLSIVDGKSASPR